MAEDPTKVTSAALYRKMEEERRPFVQRAEENASLTVPAAFPMEHHALDDDFTPPMSSIGARGVNSLSAALLLATIPPNFSYVRLSLNPTVQAQILEEAGEDAKRVQKEFDEALSLYEKESQMEVERRHYRAPLGRAIKQLLVAGNALVYAPENGKMRVYKLRNYGRRNYPDGQVRTIIISEMVTTDQVPARVAAMSQPDDPDQGLWAMYTRLEWHRTNGTVELTQEIAETQVNSVSYAKGRCPYIPLAWSQEDGEHYGRSFVEDYIGELATTDSLIEALTHGAAAAAELRILVDPTGVTEQKALEAPNLSVRPGRNADVSVIQANKFGDFSVAANQAEKNKSVLAQVFLMADGMVRQAERVTAEEIRMLQEQLNRPLGGAFSEIAEQLQKPLIRLVLSRLAGRGAMPSLPEDLVDLTITTGVEAISRALEADRLKSFVAEISSLGPEVLQWLKIDGVIRELATARQIDQAAVLRTQEEIQAMQQQAAQAQAAQSLVDGAAPAVGAAAAASITQPEGQQEA